MATLESEISTGGKSDGNALVYDGFISYSHAADDLLAPRLQAGLQRFAKPWWKRRALRIFRDESSLSANPHLWSSITEALDSSGWFVLLLSPDAAESHWVNQEIEYWKEHKDRSRILPVLTDGTFGWAGGDVSGTAVPDQLKGFFSEEPRWVDMRFAREETNLDLKDPRFADAVADIASALRGVPKDDLASEEVKQHRRTIRTAWSAGVLVLLLGIAAVFAAVQATQNANEARSLAEAEAAARTAEGEARAEAEANAAEADAQREAAVAQAQLARSRELATSALEALEQDPELATLLSLEAIHAGESLQDQPPVVLNALWRAIESDQLEYVMKPGEYENGQLSLSSDDRLLAFKTVGMLALYEVPAAELVWTFSQPSSPDQFLFPVFSPDGSRIALSVADSRSSTFPGIQGREPDELPNRILIIATDTGDVLQTLEYPDCEAAYAPAWSQDGALLAVSSGWGTCGRNGTEGVWVELVETTAFTTHALVAFDDEIGPFPQFLPNGDLILLGFGVDAAILSAPGYSERRTLDNTAGFGEVSPDGRYLSTFSPARPDGQILYDLESEVRVDIYPVPIFPALPAPASFSADSSKLIVQTEGRDTVVFDVVSGTVLHQLPGGAGGNPAMSSDGEWLYTSHRDGTLKAWNLAPRTVGQTVIETLPENSHVQAGPPFSAGPELGAAFLLDVGQAPLRPWTALFSKESGEIVHEIDGFWQAKPLADGRFVGRASLTELGVYDPVSEKINVIIGCESNSEEPPFLCEDAGEPAFDLAFEVSVDGRDLLIRDNQTEDWWIASPDDGSVIERGSFELPGSVITFTNEWIASFRDTEHLTVWDRPTGDIRHEVRAEEGPRSVSRQGDLIAVPTPGAITFFATESGETWQVEADVARARGVAFSSSGSRLAVGDENKLVVVDVEERRPTLELPIAGASSFYWFDEETFLMGTRFPARWVSISLDVAQLERAGQESVTRSFTEAECAKYEIDPCPTLDEIRGR